MAIQKLSSIRTIFRQFPKKPVKLSDFDHSIYFLDTAPDIMREANA